jgi:hypothetical protein
VALISTLEKSMFCWALAAPESSCDDVDMTELALLLRLALLPGQGSS